MAVADMDLLVARYDLANLANDEALGTGEQMEAGRRSVVESAVRQPPQQRAHRKRAQQERRRSDEPANQISMSSEM